MNNSEFILRPLGPQVKLSTRYICFMRIAILFSLQFIFIIGVIAQSDDLSLTEEFPSLSAKQRARIAKKEAKEAESDFVFQGLMQDADSLFQQGEHNASLSVYKSARERRPYNVHPKVKIQDLQDLIDQEAQMNGELANDQAETPIVISDLNSTPTQIHTIPEEQNSSKLETPPLEKKSTAVLVTKSGVDQPIAPKPVLLKSDNKGTLEKKIVKKDPDPVKTILSEPSVFDIPIAEDGVDKEIYREGNAVITQLTVVRNGRTDIYKKVYHQWGYVFYFKNGSAITERMWADETLTFY